MSTSAPTRVLEVSGAEREVRSYVFSHEDVGIPRADPADVTGGTPQDNARITKGILHGEHGARRDLALLNAGAAIYAAGRAESLVTGYELALEAVDSGAGATLLERFVAFTRDAVPAGGPR